MSAPSVLPVQDYPEHAIGERVAGIRVAVARWKAWITPIAILLVLIVALLVLRHELAATGYRRVAAALTAIPWQDLTSAVLLTVLAYGLLTGYDILALRYVGAGLSIARTSLASLLAYALSQTIGFPLLSGGAVRVR